MRSTDDLDVFLRTEILADPAQAKQLAEALAHLKFEVIETASLSIPKSITRASQAFFVKIDLLTGLPDLNRWELACGWKTNGASNRVTKNLACTPCL